MSEVGSVVNLNKLQAGVVVGNPGRPATDAGVGQLDHAGRQRQGQLQPARGRCPPQEVDLQTEDIGIRVADAGVHDAALYPSRRVAGYAYSNDG